MSIKASELRIGNIVGAGILFNNEGDEIGPMPSKVLEISGYDILWTGNLKQDIEDMRGDRTGLKCVVSIPLTEAWLLRFGFVDTNNGYRATGAEVVYELNTSGRPIRLWWDWPEAWVFESWNDLSLKYVHQLQNLYHSLTGEELTIKEPA